MRYLYKSKLGSTLVAMALFAGGTHSAFAVGTATGVAPITNTASVDYTVGGVNQDDINSNTDSFVVDSKVDLTVALVADATVAPGSTQQVLVYSVSNLGNTDQAYALAATPTTGTDDFDALAGTVDIYLDNGTTPGVLDGSDTLYVPGTTVVDIPQSVLAADVAANSTVQVLVVSDIPTTVTDGQTAIYDLTATTLDSGSATVVTAQTPAGTADNDTVVDVVFADGQGTTDAATPDGIHSAAATYTVATAALAVAKDSTVISDPFNLTTNPKAIPGAVVEYAITVTNTGGLADSVIITDPVPLNTTYVLGSLSGDGSASGDATAPVVEYSTDGLTFSTTEPATGTSHVRVTFNSLTDGSTAATTATMTFRVTIN